MDGLHGTGSFHANVKSVPVPLIGLFSSTSQATCNIPTTNIFRLTDTGLLLQIPAHIPVEARHDIIVAEIHFLQYEGNPRLRSQWADITSEFGLRHFFCVFD
jgi:hypothetical protein